MPLIPCDPPQDAAVALRRTPMLAELDEAELLAVLECLSWFSIAGGEVLFRDGDPGDAMYFLVSGGMRVFEALEGGEERVIATLNGGTQLGELALLTGLPRSASVRATRDSLLGRLSVGAFTALLSVRPECHLALARSVARMLVRSDSADRRATTATLTVLPLDRAVLDFADKLAGVLDDTVQVQHVDAALVDHMLERPGAARGEAGSDDAERVARLLQRLETHNEVLMFETDIEDNPWTRRCLRQSDRVLVVAHAGRPPDLGPAGPLLAALAERNPTVRRELVLVHPEGTVMPSGTAGWLRLHPFHTHLHVLEGDTGDLARVVRHLLNRSVGVVLGGGGARAFAHVGVLRALTEAGVPIDAVGGASMGAVVGGRYCMRRDVDDLELTGERFKAARVQSEVTLPLISVLSVRRARRLYAEVFADTRIEDLWLPYFCLTISLTSCTLNVHRSGPLGRYAFAGASPPGIWPPTVEPDGELLADGGVLDNLPCTHMRALGVGTVIASSVSKPERMTAEPGQTDVPSAWSYLARLVNPLVPNPTFPNISTIIYRTASITGNAAADAGRRQADAWFAPPVDDFTIGSYDRVGELIARGYGHARERLGELMWRPDLRLRDVGSLSPPRTIAPPTQERRNGDD